MNPSWIYFAADTLTMALMHFVWQGAALTLVLLTIIKVMHVRTIRLRYLLSVGTLLAMGAAPLLTIALHFSRVEAAYGAAHESVQWNHSSAEVRGTSRIQPGFLTDHDLTRPLERIQFQFCVMVIWLAGVVLLGTRLAIGLGATWWMRSHAKPLPAHFEPDVRNLGRRLGMNVSHRVFACMRVGQAVAVGFLRPIVLIPTSWLTQLPPQVLQAVIAHELAHIRRWDLWINLVQRVMETLLFYHPAVWWLSRRIQLEREMCCDEIAAKIFDRAMYARSLESVARIAQGNLILGTSILEGNKMKLLSRIRYVLGAEPADATVNLWAAGFVAMVLPFAAAVLLSAGVATVGSVAMADDSKQVGQQNETQVNPPKKEESVASEKADDTEHDDRKVTKIFHQFLALMEAKDWDAAERLALDAAKKYNNDDALIQRMLLESLNAKRKIQGLPIIKLPPQIDPNTTYVLKVYQIKEFPLWSKDGQKQDADFLINVISLTVDPAAWKDGKSRAIYSAKDFSLVVFTTLKNHQDINALMNKLVAKPNPVESSPAKK